MQVIDKLIKMYYHNGFVLRYHCKI